MIKSVESQKQTRMTIVKDNEIVAYIYVNGMHGVVDADKVKVETCNNMYDRMCEVKLEV